MATKEELRNSLQHVSTPRLKILKTQKRYPRGQVIGKRDKEVIREILKVRRSK